MTAPIKEPSIPERIQRPLTAVWVSIGLHAAVIALVQVAPYGAAVIEGPLIEARLVTVHADSAVDRPSAPQLEATSVPEAMVEPIPASKPLAPPESTRPTAQAVTTEEAEPAVAPTVAASPLTITSAVDLTYYSVREIDVVPRAVSAIVPDYPLEADSQKLSGKVTLQLKIEADGRVSEVDVVNSVPSGVFDTAAIKAFRNARFTPAQKNGRPVRVQVRVPVAFDWEGRPQ